MDADQRKILRKIEETREQAKKIVEWRNEKERKISHRGLILAERDREREKIYLRN